jgi:hypothetical protein
MEQPQSAEEAIALVSDAAEGLGQQPCPLSSWAVSSADAGGVEQQQFQQNAGDAARRSARTRPIAF